MPLDIPSGATLEVQKWVRGTGGVVVKRGPGSLIAPTERLDREFTVAGIRMEGGAWYVGSTGNGAFRLNPTAGFTITFANNDSTEVFTLRKGDLMVRNLTLEETEDVDNTGHGFDSPAGHNLAFLGGTSKVSPMSFTGSFKGSAGLVWAPADSDTEIVLKKAAHTTTGGIWVSNGVVRVSEGASFLSLTNVTVHGSGATFAVDASARQAFPEATFEIASGGRLCVEAGAYMTVAAVTVDGVAVVDGVYRGPDGPVVGDVAAWLDGAGVVVVGAPFGGAAGTATWNGAGTDTAATTLANWNGAAELPDLTNGVTSVSVTGGSASRLA